MLEAGPLEFSLGFWLLMAVGPAIGIAGGAFGVWNSLRKCESDQERRVIWKWTWVLTLGILLMLTVLFLVPAPWGWFAWIPYGAFLPLSINACNRQLHQARASVIH